jgi:hypothetical protein
MCVYLVASRQHGFDDDIVSERFRYCQTSALELTFPGREINPSKVPPASNGYLEMKEEILI